MPCKYHHCIPYHESNIPSIDYFLNRPPKTLVFALVLVASYALVPMKQINTAPRTIWRSVSVSHPRQSVYGKFFKNRGEVSITTNFVDESWGVVRLNNHNLPPLASCFHLFGKTPKG